ncbi:MAG: ATP-binding protein [Candidatus Micrarchaeaceae archaeon]
MLLEYMLGKEFILYHDIIKSTTSIISPNESVKDITNSLIGLSVEEVPEMPSLSTELIVMPIAIFQPKVQAGPVCYPLDALYDILPKVQTKILTVFSCPSNLEIVRLKHSTEDRISKIEVRQSHSIGIVEPRKNSSTSMDSYYESYEKKLLGMILENINDILLSKYSSYKVEFVIENDENAENIIKYLKSNTIVLNQQQARIDEIPALFDYARRTDSVPLSYPNASQALALSPRIRKATKMATGTQIPCGDIQIGRYIDSAITETKEDVSISSKVMNLGTLITGLPGTGKTRAAKNIIEKSISLGSKVVIISPTEEWDAFGLKNSLNVIKIGKSETQINLFKCETANVKRFYENLSMLISAGCNSGPYKNSVEKCLLLAFSKVYFSTNNPDPQSVYDEIEESIIEQHGKRTSTSVKYTKHGENARAALESLRQLLMIPQFAYSEGISMAKLIEGGIVFDLSEISNNIKPLLYAMILNQVYNTCDEFDLNGDNKLRLVLCLEEAQLVFNVDTESGATADLKQRIQNFRKNGIALMLITHNVTDISPNIRRLCQNKIYFRQSSDIAKYAANDLIFDELEYAKAIEVLKTLGQRECAIGTVYLHNNEKKVLNSFFSKTSEYNGPENDINPTYELPKQKSTAVRINGKNVQGSNYRIEYLGESIISGCMPNSVLIIENLLKDKTYKLKLLGERKKDDKVFRIIGGLENSITL